MSEKRAGKDFVPASLWGCLPSVWVSLELLLAASGAAAPAPQGELLGSEGSVDFARGQTNWSRAIVGQQLVVADRLRTLQRSRAILKLAELGRFRVNELTTLEVLPPREMAKKVTLDLKAGAMYFFTRDRPREFQIQTPYALAASRGTEFLVSISQTGQVTFAVFDGEVDLTNAFGGVSLASGEIGTVDPGQAPVKTAVIQATNIIQWWLYYPAVLDANELPLTPAEQSQLSASLSSYRAGDLLLALQNYPAGRTPQSDGERAFLAALLLAVGQLEQAEIQLASLGAESPLSQALREMIATVQNQPRLATLNTEPSTASAWLARSYSQQASYDLAGALASTRAAVKQSPEFGFAWERVAELEFSFGRTAEATKALDHALELSPRNAQAWALKGFLGAAANRLKAATNAFQTAIDLDPALGNGWLGRGLVRIRMGDAVGGRVDLQTAAALEPNRSVLRSYLGKAFDNLGETTNAVKELHLAQRLDDADPTPWLYSALLLRQQLRFNEALDDLERSINQNENRRVYRSRLLLDQDYAVRSTSLATIYQNAGMDEVSVREAARAVAYDYGNHSAHLFLAESFNTLRDPTRFNLRTETAWFNELLLANLLAPVGGGNLSQNVSQQEYSRLFEGNRIGLSTFSEYRSDGQFRELASQFGIIGNTGYSLDVDFQHNDGVRPNNDLSRLEWYATIKQQLTAKDSVLILTKYQDYHSGDNFQNYDLSASGVVRTNFTFDEFQKPLAVAGYHHEWSPGVHTLALAGRLENDQRFSDKDARQIILVKGPDGTVFEAAAVPFDVSYRSELEIFTGELNQIFQGERHTLVLGGRFQSGTFATTDRVTLASGVSTNFAANFDTPPASGDVRDDFERLSGYGYYTLELIDDLLLTAGLAYDQITFPENHRQPPIAGGSMTRDRLNPKAALVWSPLREVTLRGVFSRALGGVSFDESFRLEPTQLAGFNQSFRTIIPETLAGSVSAPTYQIAGGALDVKLKTRTYFGLQAEVLNSEVRRQIGVFDDNGGSPPPPPIVASSTPQRLEYEEHSFVATLNQLVSDAWSFGAQYRFTRSDLRTVLPAIPVGTPGIDPDHTESADLQQTSVFALFNHPSGFFARGEGHWYHQDNSNLPASDFWQGNFFLGWRLRRQRGEISIGVMNFNDTDYRLNPLNLYAELPRERVFVVRLKLNL